MKVMHLAQQFLLREWRSGELRLLVFALILAIASVATISLITDRLSHAMGQESAELIGGDLVISGTRKPDSHWISMGKKLGMNVTTVLSFDSMLFFDDNMMLSGIKAVSEPYPLLGQLQAADQVDALATPTTSLPTPGNAWVDPRVLDKLGAKLGDSIYFGTMKLRLDKVLTYEPDQGNSLFQLAPRTLINTADLQKAEVLGPGSRIRYRTLFSGSNSKLLKQQLQPLLTTGHKLIDPATQDGRSAEALTRAMQFIKLATLLTLILAAITIGLAARRYSERHYDVSAMLRCLGAQQRQIIQLYIYQLGLITTISIFIGGTIGWLSHWGLMTIIAPLLPSNLPSAGWEPLLIASATALLLVIGFALPPILRLSKSTPLRVFRRDLEPNPLSAKITYGAATAVFLLLIWLLFDDIRTIIVILTLILGGVLVTGWMIYHGFKWLRHSPLAYHPFMGRSLRNLATHAVTSTSQVLAFSLAMMVIVVISQLRTGLLTEWQLQLPKNAPNHFAFNILASDINEFTQHLEASTRLLPAYPVVRGRLIAINNKAVASSEAMDTNRELNLTWASELPTDNNIVEGHWPPQAGELSLEVEYAKRLGVGPGDDLQFNTGGHHFTVTVTSLRSVVWESFSPNFYLIFSAQTLQNLPATYLTSFYLNPSQKSLLRTLSAKFPSITLIDVDAFLSRLQKVLSQATMAIEMMMIFVVIGGFAVLFATLQSTTDERIQESALMRTFGASRRYITLAYLIEFGLIGLIAGLIATLGAEVIRWLIYTRVFNLDFTLNLTISLTVPLLVTCVVSLGGYWGSRKILKTSPIKLLN